MTKRRFLHAGGLVCVAALLLTAAGCASYHAALGVHYGHYPGAYPAYVYGSSFYLGPSWYQVVYQPRARGYFFRTRALGPGHHCSRYCYTRGRYTYHHATCGRFGRVASLYGTHAGLLIDAYGPR